MYQTLVDNGELSKVDDLVKAISNEVVNSALQVLLTHFADVVANRVLAQLSLPPVTPPQETTSTPTETVVEPPSVVLYDPAKTNRRGPVSEETKKRIAESQRARWARARGLSSVVTEGSPEPTQPATANGKKRFSEETKLKMSLAQKARWEVRLRNRQGSASNDAPTPPLEDDRPDLPEVTSDLILKEATLVVSEGYEGDPIYLSEDGHYIGDDGFIVPKDFDEFSERFPKYIENWVRRRLGGYGIEEDIEDWCQELVIHMKYLPPTSKHRALGKEDVIQTFNPFSQFGASQRRWRHYVNNCMVNKFNTIHGKKSKNPVCRPGNLTIASETNPDNLSEVSDEYIYSKSAFLSSATSREEKNKSDLFFASNYIEFVKEVDPEVFPILEAVYITGSSTDTIKEFCQTCKRLATTKEVSEGQHKDHEIGITPKEFNRARARLRKLAMVFMTNRKQKQETLTEADAD